MEFPLHWVVILGIVVLLFGGRKIPEVMRGLGEGIRSFKEGMREPPSQPQPPSSNTTSAPPATTAVEKK